MHEMKSDGDVAEVPASDHSGVRHCDITHSKVESGPGRHSTPFCFLLLNVHGGEMAY